MEEDKIKVTINEIKGKKIDRKKGKKMNEFFNRKRIVIAVAVVLLAGLAVGIYKKIQHNKTLKEAQSTRVELVDQYKKQLPELKERASSNTANDLQNYAIALYATGNLGEAEQAYQKQLAVDGNNSVAHNNLANVLRDEKKFEEASQHYEQSLKLSPKSINTYINLGNLYQYSLKDTGKAIEVYNRGIEANPESVDLNILVALAYERAGDKENAQKSFEKALKLQGENKTAKAGLERLKD